MLIREEMLKDPACKTHSTLISQRDTLVSFIFPETDDKYNPKLVQCKQFKARAPQLFIKKR